MSKPANVKGTRDFGPKEMVKRNFIFNTIRKHFSMYGYSCIETPAMETNQTLMGKYGEEGDRLIFKIVNSGDFLKDADSVRLTEKDSLKILPQISEKALRYDLTVPFARFVVQHQNEISFPFKRYQIQPVWRADRPQKGRYREFYQCDADVVGSDSLLYELEFIQLFDAVLNDLGIHDFTIKINNRKILSGIAEILDEAKKIVDITVAIDKLDKIGIEGVNKELVEKDISEAGIQKLQPLLNFKGDLLQKIEFLRNFLSGSEIGLRGITELEFLFERVESLNPEILENKKLELDLTLARGLNYYTGAIFEVKANGVQMGSICGGGRYDDLTGIFGLKNVSGVGISFGADRIYDVLEELNLFPDELVSSSKVLIINFGGEEESYGLQILQALRKNGLSSEMYPDDAKMKKQMKYADDKGIPFVIMPGEEERTQGKVTLKNMLDGSQESLSIEAVIKKFV